MTSSEAWRAQAACRNVPTDQMFPHEGDKESLADLLEMCNRNCPVKAECLAFADSFENTYRGTFGIYGGLTPRERIARRLNPQPVRKCSTPGRRRSVELHFRKGEQLCEACQRWQDNRDTEQVRWEKVRELILAGHTNHEITWMAGVHKDTVRRLRIKMQSAIVPS